MSAEPGLLPMAVPGQRTRCVMTQLGGGPGGGDVGVLSSLTFSIPPFPHQGAASRARPHLSPCPRPASSRAAKRQRFGAVPKQLRPAVLFAWGRIQLPPSNGTQGWDGAQALLERCPVPPGPCKSPGPAPPEPPSRMQRHRKVPFIVSRPFYSRPASGLRGRAKKRLLPGSE